ncbi:mycothiol synthase [Nocardioides mangrovicus]|uniref:Mycothiol acetyltransferase n=1 Tax=Nocardioides mangrovicus TaxID=2478913 RepID=A0A3L8P011_9ACTN|nr:mycothiol synthase [Nocardioides mangrovicus]
MTADEFDWSASTGPAAQLRAIAAAADEHDGVVSLNEAAQLHLKHRGLDGSTLVLDEGGFALLTGSDLDLVVAPEARSHGLGTALAREALSGVDREIDAWSHSDCGAAARIAERLGLPRERELWVMSRPLDATLPAAEPSAGYTVRTFRDGDEEGLLETNALAFSHHPEQGHMSLADFRERQSEDWFDPAGLFLAVDSEEQILGFHWTKVHREENLGEVYVVAVNPRAAGRGIGKVLTNAGLLHLRDLGLPTVILYVDGDNAPAIAVYDGAGFTRVRVEAQYRGVPALAG